MLNKFVLNLYVINNCYTFYSNFKMNSANRIIL